MVKLNQNKLHYKLMDYKVVKKVFIILYIIELFTFIKDK